LFSVHPLAVCGLLENAHGSQYRPLYACLDSYLRLHPDREDGQLEDYLQDAMVAIQLQVISAVKALGRPDLNNVGA
jgi:hypothetical protein